MKIILALLLLSINAYSNSIKIEVSPEKPVFGETFEVKFIIKSDVDEQPIINFDPLAVEVISRSGVSTNTRMTYINGESSIEKTMSVVYEMSAPTAGGAFLRNITVDLGSTQLKHPTFKINVGRTAQKSKNVFVAAEVSKESIFVGEGFTVRYYLYSHANTIINQTDIERFPKLDKFLKRFHQENLRPERVSINGKIYVRRIMYTAQLFGSSVGKFKVDPIRLKLIYSEGKNPFSSFGFNIHSGRRKTTRVSSKPVEIEVMTLPNEGMEGHFSGLVGKHNFSLKKGKDRFISNEPIELQLTVEGDGAMELFEAPTLFNDPNLEEFEKSSDFQINKNFTAVKKINYTYLGRGNVDLKDIEVPISYFDPDKKEYITEILKIGDIVVAGTSAQDNGKATVTKPSEEKCKDVVTSNSNFNDPLEPGFMKFEPLKKPINTFMFYTKEVFILFTLIILGLLGYLTFQLFSNREKKELTAFEGIIQNGVSYNGLHTLLNDRGRYQNMSDAIEDLPLSTQCKDYFSSLINTLNTFFSNGGTDHKLVVNKKYFKELDKALKKKGNEKS